MRPILDNSPSLRKAVRRASVPNALVADSKLPDVLGDQAMLERWQALDALPQGERQRILDVLDSLIRDAQARIAYAKPG
jgi:hypothetical protein